MAYPHSSSAEPNVGVFAEDEAVVGLVGAILLGQSDEGAVQRARTVTPETTAAPRDDAVLGMPALSV